MSADGDEADSLDVGDEMSDMAWQGHRKRQLEELGIDPDELDGDDQ